MVTNVSLMADADDGTHYARMGVGNTWEISVRSSPFPMNLKLLLKIVFLKFYLSKKIILQKSRKKTQNVRLRKCYSS